MERKLLWFDLEENEATSTSEPCLRNLCAIPKTEECKTSIDLGQSNVTPSSLSMNTWEKDNNSPFNWSSPAQGQGWKSLIGLPSPFISHRCHYWRKTEELSLYSFSRANQTFSVYRNFVTKIHTYWKLGTGCQKLIIDNCHPDL